MSEFNKARVDVCTRRAVGGETRPSFSKGQVAGAGLAVSQSVGVDLRNRPEC